LKTNRKEENYYDEKRRRKISKNNTVFASNFIKKKTFSRLKSKNTFSRPNIVAHFRKWSTILLKKKQAKKKHFL